MSSHLTASDPAAWTVDAAAARVLVIIPARLAATRLPGKPLLDIAGSPMIVQVWRRAIGAEVGPVIVACDDTRIADAISSVGGIAVMTRTNHASGSDRIHEALTTFDPDRQYDTILNVQGDLPTIERAAIRAALLPLAGPAPDGQTVDIATICAEITREDEKTAPSVVKVVGTPVAPGRLRALYFTRATAPTGPGPLYHHIGLYAYRRASLERFVALPPGTLEEREKLEQLRALEAGMRIDVGIVDTVPLGVDTPDDLERARAILEGGL